MEVKTVPCQAEQVRVVFKAIMGIADGQATNGQLSTQEASPKLLTKTTFDPLHQTCRVTCRPRLQVTTYLAGTAFDAFSKWLLAPFTHEGVYTSKFKIYAHGDGLLNATELLPPVTEYLESHFLAGSPQVAEGGEVHQMIQVRRDLDPAPSHPQQNVAIPRLPRHGSPRLRGSGRRRARPGRRRTGTRAGGSRRRSAMSRRWRRCACG